MFESKTIADMLHTPFSWTIDWEGLMPFGLVEFWRKHLPGGEPSFTDDQGEDECYHSRWFATIDSNLQFSLDNSWEFQFATYCSVELIRKHLFWILSWPLVFSNKHVETIYSIWLVANNFACRIISVTVSSLQDSPMRVKNQDPSRKMKVRKDCCCIGTWTGSCRLPVHVTTYADC